MALRSVRNYVYIDKRTTMYLYSILENQYTALQAKYRVHDKR